MQRPAAHCSCQCRWTLKLPQSFRRISQRKFSLSLLKNRFGFLQGYLDTLLTRPKELPVAVIIPPVFTGPNIFSKSPYRERNSSHLLGFMSQRVSWFSNNLCHTVWYQFFFFFFFRVKESAAKARCILKKIYASIDLSSARIIHQLHCHDLKCSKTKNKLVRSHKRVLTAALAPWFF